MYDQFAKRKTRGPLETKSLAGSNLYLKKTIVHFIMVFIVIATILDGILNYRTSFRMGVTCQVWFILIQRFVRKSLKCIQLMLDDK
jgi:phage-related holin